MTSQAKINANRKNAARSTGPRTPAGKSSASKNALRHGLLAKIASLPEADQAEYRTLLEGIEDNWEPKGAMEDELVAQITECAWRNRRLLQVECEAYTYQDHDRRVSQLKHEHERQREELIGRQDFLANPPALAPLRRATHEAAQQRDEAAMLALTFLGASSTLDKTFRYGTANEKKMYKAIDRLERLQAARADRTAASSCPDDARDGDDEPQVSSDPRTEGPEPSQPTLTAPSAAPDERASSQTKPTLETHRIEAGNSQGHDDDAQSTARADASPATGAMARETKPPGLFD
jgi:hypothetical protein